MLQIARESSHISEGKGDTIAKELAYTYLASYSDHRLHKIHGYSKPNCIVCSASTSSGK